MQSQRSTRRTVLAKITIAVVSVIGLSACIGPAPDPLLDDDVRVSAVEAAEHVADYLALVDLPGATTLAAQEADFCLRIENTVFGDPTPEHWRCTVYAIQVFQSPEDDPERLADLIKTALEQVDHDVRVTMQETRAELPASGDSILLATALVRGEGIWFEVAIGRDSTSITALISSYGRQERLMDSRGDALLTIPTRAADPVTCDCVQMWVTAYTRYADVEEPRWPTYLDV